jgi:hypothetical protein
MTKTMRMPVHFSAANDGFPARVKTVKPPRSASLRLASPPVGDRPNRWSRSRRDWRHEA